MVKGETVRGERETIGRGRQRRRMSYRTFFSVPRTTYLEPCNGCFVRCGGGLVTHMYGIVLYCGRVQRIAQKEVYGLTKDYLVSEEERYYSWKKSDSEGAMNELHFILRFSRV